MMLNIKDKNIEEYTNISIADYIETIQQGYCKQCGENIPQEDDLSPFHFRCPEHGQIEQAEGKCPDCGEPLKLDFDYYLIDGRMSQHRKQHLLCGCDNRVWLTFYRRTDSYFTTEKDNIPIALTVVGHKWVHDMRNAQLINKITNGKLVRISTEALSGLSQANICFLDGYLKSEIGNGQRERNPYRWYYKILSDTIELGVNIETLHLLLCQTFASHAGYMNWSIKNSIQEIVQYNPTKFRELISRKFETSCVASRRILAGQNDSRSITIYSFNKKFIQLDKIENRISDYADKYENFSKKIITKCISHCDINEYESRDIRSHEDFMINVASENTESLCKIYNDYILKSIGDLNTAQNLKIKLPYSITYGSISNLSSEARQRLIEILRDTDSEITRMKESLEKHRDRQIAWENYKSTGKEE